MYLQISSVNGRLSNKLVPTNSYLTLGFISVFMVMVLAGCEDNPSSTEDDLGSIQAKINGIDYHLVVRALFVSNTVSSAFPMDHVLISRELFPEEYEPVGITFWIPAAKQGDNNWIQPQPGEYSIGNCQAGELRCVQATVGVPECIEKIMETTGKLNIKVSRDRQIMGTFDFSGNPVTESAIGCNKKVSVEEGQFNIPHIGTL